jgi:hypothetical protein
MTKRLLLSNAHYFQKQRGEKLFISPEKREGEREE